MTTADGVRVLLADDETHIRAMLRKILIGLEATVIGEASNGAEALEMFQKERPAAVVLDINMPLKNGDEALREIKAVAPGTVAIIMTSMADRETIERCISAGAESYILKDNSLAEIKRLLREALGGVRRGEAQG